MNDLEQKGYARFIIDLAKDEINLIAKSLMLNSGQKAEAIKKCRETRNKNLHEGGHLKGLIITLSEEKPVEKVEKELVREYGYTQSQFQGFLGCK